MDLIFAKAKKRLREEGRETTFYHNGVQLPQEMTQFQEEKSCLSGRHLGWQSGLAKEKLD
jgi:hypothetical protein